LGTTATNQKQAQGSVSPVAAGQQVSAPAFQRAVKRGSWERRRPAGGWGCVNEHLPNAHLPAGRRRSQGGPASQIRTSSNNGYLTAPGSQLTETPNSESHRDSFCQLSFRQRMKGSNPAWRDKIFHQKKSVGTFHPLASSVPRPPTLVAAWPRYAFASPARATAEPARAIAEPARAIAELR
jgi:hypothetical protein